MRLRPLLAVILAASVVILAVLGLTRAVRDQPPVTPQAVAADVADSLRCPTCQGLSVADSPAPMAQGMRTIIDEQVAEGRTPDEIRQYFVDRYGEWVLLSPPRRGVGWLVWLLPAAALIAGVVLALRAVRRRRETERVDESQLEHARAVYADYLAGRYVPDDTPAGERVEAALELLVSLDEEDLDQEGNGSGSARQDAVQRLAGALVAAETHELGAAMPEADDAPEPADTPLPARSRRRWPVYGLAVAFIAVLAGLLVTNLGGRGPDGLPTGSLADDTAAEAAETEARIEALRADADKQPQDPDVWLTLGQALDEAGRLGEAYTAYERALELDPADPEAARLGAWALIRGGSPSEAIPLVEPLIQRDPKDAGSVLLLGLAQYGADDPAATATLRRYLDLEPNGPQADQIRALLDGSSTPSRAP